MTYRQIMDLLYRYDEDCRVLSFIEENHPSVVELKANLKEAMPTLVEQLRAFYAYFRMFGTDPTLPIGLIVSLVAEGLGITALPEDICGKFAETLDLLLFKCDEAGL